MEKYRKKAQIVQLEFDPRQLVLPTFMLDTVRGIASTMTDYIKG